MTIHIYDLLLLDFCLYTENEKITFKSYVIQAVDGAVRFSSQHSRLNSRSAHATHQEPMSFIYKWKRAYHLKHNFSFTINNQHAISSCVVSFSHEWWGLWLQNQSIHDSFFVGALVSFSSPFTHKPRFIWNTWVSLQFLCILQYKKLHKSFS